MNVKNKIYNQMYSIVRLRWNISYRLKHKLQLRRFRKGGFSFAKCEREDEFIQKWKVLYKYPSIDDYRFYASFIGEDPNILPDDLFHIIVEPTLNSQNALSLFSDKNLYDKLVDDKAFPVCLLRNIDGDYFDSKYKLLNSFDGAAFNAIVLNNAALMSQNRFIIKPTVDSCGGNGVRLFKLTEKGDWRNDDGITLSFNKLIELYHSNFVIQECVEPSEFVKQFNPESYNTFRVITYRSVIDDEPKLLGFYMRIGVKGSFKDNVHSGGFVCPVGKDGKLFHYALDGQRKRHSVVNGINLENGDYQVPNYGTIIDFVFQISRKMLLQRLLSFDIILDENNQPRIIEINIKNQTIMTVQTTTGTFFGELTDEVIEYCRTHKDKICYESVFRKLNK